MSEKICPVCGKPNPEEAEVCQFCGSNFVKDTSAIQGESTLTDLLAGLAKLNDEEEEVPSWLKDLQGNMPAAPELKSEPAADQGPASEVPGNQPPLDQPQSSESDYAGGTGGVFQPDENSELFAQAGGEIPDWLKALQSDDENKPAEEEPQPDKGQTQPGAVDVPDWLAALTGTAGPESQPGQPVQPAGDNGPDWLSDLNSTPMTGEPAQDASLAAAEKADLPDWLSTIGSDESPATDLAPEEDKSASNLPAWLADLQRPPSSSEENAIEPGAPAEETSEVLPAADLPSWLTDLQKPDLGSEETPSEPAAPAEETPAALPAGDLPSWLTDLQSPLTAAGEPVNEAEPPALSETSLPGGTPSNPTDGDLPEWMIEALNARAAGQPEVAAQPEPAESGDFSSLAPTEEAAAPAEEETPSSASLPPMHELAGEIPVVLPANEEQAVSKDASEPEKNVEPVSLIEASQAMSAETKDEPPISVPEEQQNIDSILAMDTPEWLSGFTPEEPAPSSPTVDKAPAPSEELPAAELPSWLQIIRPVESSMDVAGESDEEENIEVLGPLAGLSSVLPTQPKESAGIYSPNAYSGKLLINETQQTQAALLEKLLSSESNSQAFSKPHAAFLNRPLRWIIAAVLLAAILTNAILSPAIFPSPAAPAESSQVGMFLKTINGLPDGASVLVVMDYQPGFAGELEPAGGPVIDKLMGKDARLAFLSTSPLGGLMAERLVQKFASAHNYAARSQYTNLGYLPGGAGGIRAFAEQPRSTLGQDSLLGNLWDSPALQGVTINSQTSLNNFAAMIVMTDNPDTGRLWIEQTQPSLGSTPLLMIVSAQAEPMLRPYFDSNQVKGMVSGLEGGLMYESFQGTFGQASSYWGGFGIALLTAMALIIIGGAWSMISGLRSRRAAVEQDEA